MGYKGLEAVTSGFMGLKWLQGITRGCNGLQKVKRS